MDKKNKSKLKNLVNRLRYHVIKMNILDTFSYNFFAFKDILDNIKMMYDNLDISDDKNIFDYDKFNDDVMDINKMFHSISDSKDKDRFKEYLMRLVWDISEFERLAGLFE